jgi:hypothetical protein
MKATFDNSTLKIWFANNGTSRNIHKVTEVEHVGNLMKITTEGKAVLINFDNVNLVEEV